MWVAAGVLTLAEAGRGYDEIRREVVAELRREFPPEFLNRVDETVVFRSLDRKQVAEIAGLQLDRLRQRLGEQGLSLEATRRGAPPPRRRRLRPALRRPAPSAGSSGSGWRPRRPGCSSPAKSSPAGRSGLDAAPGGTLRLRNAEAALRREQGAPAAA